MRANSKLNRLTLFLLFLLSQCKPLALEDNTSITSPDGRIQVTFLLEDGVPYYKASRSGQDVIKQSKLGFVFKLRLSLAPGGGQAIRIRPATTDEANRIPHY